MNVKMLVVAGETDVGDVRKRRTLRYWQDALVLFVACSLLFYGASWQMFRTYTDAAKYQCYAFTFWYGFPRAVQQLKAGCSFLTDPRQYPASLSQATIVSKLRAYHVPVALVHFVAAQSSNVPLHSLPREYPLLMIIPFTLAMIAPMHWYQVAFALWMALVIVVVYFILLRWRSRRAALAFALYLVIGAWSTALGRFDLLPSALTLCALLCALRMHWNWAFALLALATMCKFYPLLLLLPFLLAQQSALHSKWYAWQRWRSLCLFLALCAALTLVSLSLSVSGTLEPLSYFGTRPVQIEALSASLLWVLSRVSLGSLTYAYTFGSLNVESPLAAGISPLLALLLLLGLFYTCWLQWRAKIDLASASLLALLIVMVTGKVFSPQYLIWVVPFVAYIGECDLRWLLPWGLLGLLTSCIYPYIYFLTPTLLKVPLLPLFYPVTTLRNVLLLGLVLYLLFYMPHKQTVNKIAL